MLRDNKGVTLIALTITIIVLLILAAITIGGGKESIKMTKSNKLIAELDMVQHACLERYTEYKLTKDSTLLVGTPIDYSSVHDIANEIGYTSNFPAEGEGEFYELNPENTEDIESLGLSQIEDTYIINYENGLTINKTTHETPNGDKLYKKAN